MTRKMSWILWILSATVFCGMLAPATPEGMVRAGLWALLLAAAGLWLPELRTREERPEKRTDTAALLISLTAGIVFYRRWITSGKLARIADMLPVSKESILIAVTILAVLLSAFAVRTALYAGVRLTGITEKRIGHDATLYDTEPRISAKACAFLLVTAAAVITICSRSSPLYPLNDWVDANCYFTVGKSMLHGRVLYRDIYEHKGFYLYVLHALGYLISNTTFFGVWLLEIASAFAFLVLAYQTARLFCTNEDVLCWMPVLAAVIFGTKAFALGDSAEEFCLPLLAYALFVGAKALRNGDVPTRREFVLIGVTSGCVLWIKYTMLGFYLGWFIIPAWLMLRKHEPGKLTASLAAIALGVSLATLPVLAYFAANGALRDLGQVYFYDNIFLYAGDTNRAWQSILGTITEYGHAAIRLNRGVAVCLLLGLLWLALTRKGELLAQMVLSMASTAMFVFSSGGPGYYALVFVVFVPMALPMLGWLLARVSGRLRRCVSVLLPAAGVLLAFLLNNNASILRMPKANLPQFAFQPYVEQVENPTLLNYGFLDGGFYTVYGIVPHCKYFCRTNMPLEDMLRTQDEVVRHGLSDFVVTCNMEIPEELYVCWAQFDREGIGMYRLYALKSLGPAPGDLQ
ncbi:MAG: hypothetical protein ACI4MP_13200 [Candidatus Ventricola sp.]